MAVSTATNTQRLEIVTELNFGCFLRLTLATFLACVRSILEHASVIQL